jgi:hypothetical protein
MLSPARYLSIIEIRMAELVIQILTSLYFARDAFKDSCYLKDYISNRQLIGYQVTVVKRGS